MLFRSIARKYDVTTEALEAANPQMKADGYQLKKGEVLNIPALAVKENVWMDEADEAASLFRPLHTPLHVGIMLPLHASNADGHRMAEYYRGFLMACDALKSKGISVNIHTWNVDEKADVRTTLLEAPAADCDLIVGPYYSQQVAPLTAFCQKNRIRLLLPFAVEGNVVETVPQVFKAFQSPALKVNMSVTAFFERFPNCHPVFVDCQDATSRMGAFTAELRKRLDAAEMKYNLTSIVTNDEQFAKAFSRTQTNVVVLNSDRHDALSEVFEKMERLTAAVQGLYISVYGYTEWLSFAPSMHGLFHKYDTYVPTDYYYNAMIPDTKQFEAAYRQWFKTDQTPLLPHDAAMGYDHAMYFLLGLNTHGNAFTGSRRQSPQMKPLQVPLHFKRATETGGFMNDAFMLIHYKQDQGIDALNY